MRKTTPSRVISNSNLQTTKINNSVVQSVNINPNPVVNDVQVSFVTSDKSYVSIIIYDIFGNIVMNLMEKKLFISGKQIINANINNFTSGVYILYFSKNDISITSKIIKL